MDRYCVHAELVDDEGEWYKADEVVDLARQMLKALDGNMSTIEARIFVAELEKIVKEGK